MKRKDELVEKRMGDNRSRRIASNTEKAKLKTKPTPQSAVVWWDVQPAPPPTLNKSIVLQVTFRPVDLKTLHLPLKMPQLLTGTLHITPFSSDTSGFPWLKQLKLIHHKKKPLFLQAAVEAGLREKASKRRKMDLSVLHRNHYIFSTYMKQVNYVQQMSAQTYVRLL